MGKVEKKKGIAFALSFSTGALAGVIIGVALITMLVSYRIDVYHKEIRNMAILIEEKNIKLKKLEESINNRKYVLKSIDVIVNTNGDELDKTDIEKAIKEKYTVLIGKEVKNIDMELIPSIIDKRRFVINDREYRIRVDRVLLTEIMKIWIQAEVEE